MRNTAILMVSCPDSKGLVARAEWDLSGFSIARDEIAQAFRPLADECGIVRRTITARRITRS